MTDITNYGYLPTLDTDINSVARITAVHKDRFEIVCTHGITHARLKSSVYFIGKDNPIFPTAGDFVVIDYSELGDSQIIQTLPRKSLFSRLDPSSRGYHDQAVAANFNYVFILSSLNHDFNIHRIERYVTLAWNSGGIPVVILTKADLVDDFSEQVRLAEKFAAGSAVFAVSAKTGYGLDQLSEYLKPRKTIVFLGSSGVGKSSLVNAIAGEDIMNVNDIREDDSKGRHTTTHRQLIMMQNGVMIIDTPGMRELGMWDASSGLSEAFSDVEDYLGKCHFKNCTHGNEPGCAVQEALSEGTLSEERWKSYLQLQRESKYSEDKAEFLRMKQKWHKSIALKNKQIKKNRE